jgi:hypothetical protein
VHVRPLLSSSQRRSLRPLMLLVGGLATAWLVALVLILIELAR